MFASSDLAADLCGDHGPLSFAKVLASNKSCYIVTQRGHNLFQIP
jgi:hypothetical protein